MITVYKHGNIIKQLNETCKPVKLSHKNTLSNILSHFQTSAAANKVSLYHQQPNALEKFTGPLIQHTSLYYENEQ